jgi:excisionase family DNA binding protein
MKSPNNPQLSSKEISEYLSVSSTTIHKWIETRGFPAHRQGHLLKFVKTEVDTWLALQPATGKSVTGKSKQTAPKSGEQQKYSASFTAGGLLFEETLALLPYLNPHSINRIEEQIEDNTLLATNSEAARERVIREIRKRYAAAGDAAFSEISRSNLEEQRILLLYVCMKTYSLLFDFIIEVLTEKWLSRELLINTTDVERFLDKKSGTHNEIEEWKASTHEKVGTIMIRFLNESRLLVENTLHPLSASIDFWRFFVNAGDPWFLQAALLSKDQREQIIKG